MIIVELAARGDLKTFLRQCRPVISGGDPLVTQAELLKIALDVANGMCFLSERSIVHRDLAARLGFDPFNDCFELFQKCACDWRPFGKDI